MPIPPSAASGGVARLGGAAPRWPLLLDANVFINALSGRGPAILRALLDDAQRLFVTAPTRAELAWVRGRLHPDHPGTARVLAKVDAALARIEPSRVLVPLDPDWLAAGELAGQAARLLAGGGKKLETAFDRVELISDAITALLARQADLAVVTEDKDFEVLAKLVPGLRVLLYDRHPPTPGDV